jgi:hypothetical protein
VTGLKSGAGDDLWDDADEEPTEAEDDGEADAGVTGAGADGDRQADAAGESGASRGDDPGAGGDERPYVVRRALQDRSVQFERDERLTFFVHDDVADGERELLADAEAALGRSVPKFDLREAVYRAALRNEEDVLAELVRMGYSTEE